MTSPESISIESFDYPLPDERIARQPLDIRDSCKLLIDRRTSQPEDHTFSELPALLPPDAVLVYNNTRVINARLRFEKSTGGRIEVFCLEPASPADYAQNFASTQCCTWHCLVGNSKRWKQGPLTAEIAIDGQKVMLTATRPEMSSTTVTFEWSGGYTFAQVIAAAGEIPIPPYLNRATQPSDSTDYQTVYSRIDGSVAAPTAGLHFTPEVLQAIAQRGIPRLEVTLHVGAGTFQPVKCDAIGDHPMHSEFIVVERDTIAALAQTVDSRPTIAVGTTSVRTLESLYHIGCLIASDNWHGEVAQWYPYSASHPNLSPREALVRVLAFLDASGLDQLIASTRIMIAPGYQFRIVKGMVTNFHQPRSTLLLLVSAFLGDDRWRHDYAHALDQGYRFLSYGDACLFL